MKALSEMERTKQVEAIQSYNTMKSDLMHYLKTFVDQKKVVTQEDIKKFFDKMQKGSSADKAKMADIPKFCKWKLSTARIILFFWQEV